MVSSSNKTDDSTAKYAGLTCPGERARIHIRHKREREGEGDFALAKFAVGRFPEGESRRRKGRKGGTRTPKYGLSAESFGTRNRYTNSGSPRARTLLIRPRQLVDTTARISGSRGTPAPRQRPNLLRDFVLSPVSADFSPPLSSTLSLSPVSLVLPPFRLHDRVREL